MWKVLENETGGFDVYRADGTKATTCITFDDVQAYLNWQEDNEGIRSDHVIRFLGARSPARAV